MYFSSFSKEDITIPCQDQGSLEERVKSCFM